MTIKRTVTLILIVSEIRDPSPSSTFPPAQAIDTDGEDVTEPRPLAKVVPLRALAKVAG